MISHYKLILRYVFLNLTKISFLNFTFYQKHSIFLFLHPSYVYFLNLHLRLSSPFYSLQLTELFSYELPSSPLTQTSSTTIFVYNYLSVFSQARLFLISPSSTTSRTPLSLAELFLNANWLEREAAEMTGSNFYGKKDSRNLLLCYGDSSSPIKKAFPSIGLREIYYDSPSDTLIQNPVSIQF
jgi:NADH:ubiquinone oxidoreductase subunit C